MRNARLIATLTGVVIAMVMVTGAANAAPAPAPPPPVVAVDDTSPIANMFPPGFISSDAAAKIEEIVTAITADDYELGKTQEQHVKYSIAQVKTGRSNPEHQALTFAILTMNRNKLNDIGVKIYDDAYASATSNIDTY